jgi:hypothetical protein
MRAKDFKNNLNVMANAGKDDSDNKDKNNSQSSAGKEEPKAPSVDDNKDKKEIDEGNKVDPVKPELNDEIVLGYIKEKAKEGNVEREFNSFDDLFVEKVVEKETGYASEFSKKYDEFYKETHGSVEDFNFIQQDIDSKDEDVLIREILSFEDPDLDEEDINSIIEDEFSYDEEEDDEREIRKKKIAKKRKVSEAKKIFKERQEKFKLENKKNPSISREAIMEDIKETAKKQMDEFSKKWNEDLNKTIKGFDGLEFKAKDGFEFKFSANEEAVKNSIGIVSDVTLNSFVNQFKNDKGVVNQKALHEAIFKMKNFDDIFETAISQAIEYGKEQQLRERVNPRSRSTQRNTAGSNVKLSDEDKFRLNMINNARNKNY